LVEITRVLVVDDEASTLRLVEYILDKAGYEVCTATDGVEGLEAVETCLPHIIVADILMPRMDGLEMCRRIRQLPGFELVPFVFLSARQQIEDRVEGLETGADDFIAKPFDREELVARVAAVYRRAQTYQRISRTDQLTQLGNRDFFEDRLREELYREQRYGVSSTLALVAIDLDALGEVRHDLGSAAGDLLVRHVGRFLRDNVRALDVPTRSGDGSFIVLMPHTSRDRALVAIERLSERLNAGRLQVGEQALPVQASFGIAVVDDSLEDMTAMLNRAHTSMMAARREGGGRVHVWTPDDAVDAAEQHVQDSDR